MAKYSIETSEGTITVTEKDIGGTHPGLSICVENKQVAVVELPKESDKGSVYAWSLEDDDFTSKTTFKKPFPYSLNQSLEGRMIDVEGVEDAMINDGYIQAHLTDKERKEIAEAIRDNFDYSDYDEYIRDCITDRLT